jgi:hypothetical protein
MFKCEQPLTPHMRAAWDSLTPAERAAAVDALIADFITVARHVIGDPEYPLTRSLAALMASAEAREWPDLYVLNRVVGGVLFTLRWKQQHHPLTPAESRVMEAAWRLSDSLHGPRGN